MKLPINPTEGTPGLWDWSVRAQVAWARTSLLSNCMLIAGNCGGSTEFVKHPLPTNTQIMPSGGGTIQWQTGISSQPSRPCPTYSHLLPQLWKPLWIAVNCPKRGNTAAVCPSQTEPLGPSNGQLPQHQDMENGCCWESYHMTGVSGVFPF